MMSNNQPKSSDIQNSESRTPSVCRPINNLALEQLQDWIESRLDELVSQNVDWQTIQSNRKYFGR